MRELKGSCVCRAVEYTVPDAMKYAGCCHCSECRRFSGSAFSAFGGVPMQALRVTRGEQSLSRYAKSEHTVLVFCRHCGSSLYAEKPLRSMIHLRLGSLLDAPSLRPQFHSFVASKAPWYDIDDGLPQFEQGRPAPSSS
ncbi:GFA family protein [Aquabacterium sp. A7-Y]|uniref:GFA family protein n=1 Tax=Aquabacterium sp. A7-Y TaxID=1349605 RepID=UPI00223D9342|nr:GFA family protein [Aquabacterium sp. A7-Y]MCW7540229.1 GFA family protein [Aquabacterium sp. A7-Y]